jgi:hypothetical protein
MMNRRWKMALTSIKSLGIYEVQHLLAADCCGGTQEANISPPRLRVSKGAPDHAVAERRLALFVFARAAPFLPIVGSLVEETSKAIARLRRCVAGSMLKIIAVALRREFAMDQ